MLRRHGYEVESHFQVHQEVDNQDVINTSGPLPDGLRRAGHVHVVVLVMSGTCYVHDGVELV